MTQPLEGEAWARAARINIIAAMATVFAADVAMGLTYPILALLLEKRGFDAVAIGINGAMSAVGIIIAGWFLPGIVARIGARTTAFAGIALLVVALAGLGMSSNYLLWCMLRLAQGIGMAMLYTVSEAWIMAFTPDSRRGRITALYTTVMAGGFGLGPFLIPYTGVEGFVPFAIALVAIVVSALPLFAVSADDAHFAAEEGRSTGVVAFALRAPLLLFAVLTMTVFDSVMLNFFALYGLASGLDLKQATWLLGVAIAGCAILQLPIGWIADRFSRHVVIWACAVLTVTLSALLPVMMQSVLIWPGVFVLGASAYSIYTIALTVMGDRFKGQMLIAGSAAIGAMWGIGGISGPPTAGGLIELFGIDAFPWVLTGIYAILFAGLIVARGRLTREP